MAKRKVQMPEAVRAAFVEFGRKGGRVGGKRAQAKLTKAERSERMRKLSLKRWGGAK